MEFRFEIAWSPHDRLELDDESGQDEVVVEHDDLVRLGFIVHVRVEAGLQRSVAR